MNHQTNHSSGFTLIELMLAMTFISVLLIAIAMTTIQISNIYNKGITLREVNQAGRTVSDDLQRSINNTAPFDLTSQDQATYINTGVGGRLCFGKYSYLWNYGKAISESSPSGQMNQYSDATDTFVRFAKTVDGDHSLCKDTTKQPKHSETTELLSTGDRDLAVHSFKISKTADEPSTGEAMYAISFILGTNDQSLLATNDASCRPPSDAAGGEDYCSVNQFDIVARAGNLSEGN
jgi:type II secretory pathway pseudopilin PulG